MKQTAGLFLIVFLSIIPLFTCAQATSVPAPPRPGKIKILDEYSDGKGNIVRKVQFTQGNFIVSETIIMPIAPKIGVRVPVRPDTLIRDSLLVFIDKSDYMLTLRYRGRAIRTYKAVFGPQPLMSKMMEGDRCTPEGKFKIVSKNGTSKYDRFMGLSYPDADAQKHFNELKAAGKIPATARIGGDVGIHGIWQGGDDLIEMGIGWTDGCIALKNKDVEELFSFIGVGTRVWVQK